MAVYMTDTYAPQTAPPSERALCGSKFGSYAVAEPGARLPHLLPVEHICETCAAAHLAGNA